MNACYNMMHETKSLHEKRCMIDVCCEEKLYIFIIIYILVTFYLYKHIIHIYYYYSYVLLHYARTVHIYKARRSTY